MANRVEVASNNFSNISDYLIAPASWYGRSVVALFKDALPADHPYIEGVVRVIAFVIFAFLSPSLLAFGPLALIGLAIRNSSQPVKPTEIVHIVEDKPPIEEMQAKVKQLKDLCDSLKDLTQQQEQLQQLSQGLEEFEKQYVKYRKPFDKWNVSEQDKIFSLYDEIVSNLRGIKTALAYMGIGNWRASSDVRVEADADGVIAQLKDGNCWLHSTLCGLGLLNHPQAQEFTYETLRPVVIQWLEDNHQDQTVHQLLQTAIDDHKHAASHSLNEQRDSLAAALDGEAISQEEYTQAMQSIEAENKKLETFGLPAYFALMRRQGSHGSRAELYAISQIFRVSIHILRDFPAHNGHPRRITANWDLPINHPEAIGTINVVLNQEGNHFNYQIPQS